MLTFLLLDSIFSTIMLLVAREENERTGNTPMVVAAREALARNAKARNSGGGN